MQNNLFPLFMEVKQGRRNSSEDLISLNPIKAGCVIAKQEFIKASIGHVIIDQEELSLSPAIA
jgi:hypothetical protein